MNHDDAHHAIQAMDDAEVGRWFRGWLMGAGGVEVTDDKLLRMPLEQRSGVAAGRLSFEDAKRYSVRQKERVEKRYRKPTEILPDATTVDFGSSPVAKTLPDAYHTNNQQPTTTSQKPPARVAATTFSPTEEHQLIASTRGLDVERQAARFRETNREALDTHQNWDRRFSMWLAQGKPEPPPVAPLVANAGQSRPAPVSRPPFRWMVERDIREARAEITQLDERYKEERWEANRGTPESGKHRQAMADIRAKKATVKARIAELESRLETAV
jgi:hypothetical protein